MDTLFIANYCHKDCSPFQSITRLPENEAYAKAMDFIKSNISEGQFAFVNLMAAKGKESFYSLFGFESRPNDKAGAGMTQYVFHTEK